MDGKKHGEGIVKWAPVFGFKLYEDYEVDYSFGKKFLQRGLMSNNFLYIITIVACLLFFLLLSYTVGLESLYSHLSSLSMVLHFVL